MVLDLKEFTLLMIPHMEMALFISTSLHCRQDRVKDTVIRGYVFLEVTGAPEL